MDIRIKATDYEMAPEVEERVISRINSLEKYLGENPELSRCEIELGRDAGRPRHGKNIWFAEMRVISPGEVTVYARNNSESVNGAIDDVKDEVERQLHKKKKREQRVTRRIGARVKEWLWSGEK